MLYLKMRDMSGHGSFGSRVSDYSTTAELAIQATGGYKVPYKSAQWVGCNSTVTDLLGFTWRVVYYTTRLVNRVPLVNAR